MREPSLLPAVHEQAVPPRAGRVFGRMGNDDHVLVERQVDIALPLVREQRADPDACDQHIKPVSTTNRSRTGSHVKVGQLVLLIHLDFGGLCRVSRRRLSSFLPRRLERLIARARVRLIRRQTRIPVH